MADKNTGTGNAGNVEKTKGQDANKTGNDSRESINNRSQQIRKTNQSDIKPAGRNDHKSRR